MNVWRMISKVPFGVTFALLMDTVMGNDSYPGTSLHMLIVVIAILLTIKIIKFICISIPGVNEWAMRPDIGLPRSPGMPSSHTAVMAFFFTAFLYEILNHRRTKSIWSYRARVALTASFGVFTVLVAVSRYMTSCHTPLQIFAGALFGTVIGCLYSALAQTPQKSR
jgi:membrane-associated phospholipid phosphatase